MATLHYAEECGVQPRRSLLPPPPSPELSLDLSSLMRPVSPRKRPSSSDYSDDTSVSPKRRGSVSPTFDFTLWDSKTTASSCNDDEGDQTGTPKYLAPPPSTPGGTGGALRRSKSTEPIQMPETFSDLVLTVPSALQMPTQWPRRKSVDSASASDTNAKESRRGKKCLTLEEQEARDIKRKLNNRLAAERTRQNRAKAQREMEAKNQELISENADLRAKVQALNLETTRLKGEVTRLTEQIDSPLLRQSDLSSPEPMDVQQVLDASSLSRFRFLKPAKPLSSLTDEPSSPLQHINQFVTGHHPIDNPVSSSSSSSS
eukprot:CAMPEP_0184653644 /NCGR_PEP_ID=MMETSP0308-20130426/11375_1 /TAXON_ID=38269 /ORGANISM="Gloeochaete witrockiana, Strain SAG 46.84" /LENGTH=315 /DNA_ID=CAMNT_0027089231 /DNA_START=189 /DNA_END=1133 /DNA_ORIENTATION=+